MNLRCKWQRSVAALAVLQQSAAAAAAAVALATYSIS